MSGGFLGSIGSECATCRAGILFGGQEAGGKRYCSGRCLDAARRSLMAAEIDPEEVRREAAAIALAACPVCGDRTAPVGVWVSHRAFSFLIQTRWTSQPKICCASCGRKSLVAGILFSALFGWWGFPFGLLVTPLQIARNLAGLWVDHDDYRSPLMLAMAARKLADERLARGVVPGALVGRPAGAELSPEMRSKIRGFGRALRRLWNSVRGRPS